jgi:hypothetical protein
MLKCLKKVLQIRYHLKIITIPKLSNENQLQIWQLKNSSSKLVKPVIDEEPSKPGN